MPSAALLFQTSPGLLLLRCQLRRLRFLAERTQVREQNQRQEHSTDHGGTSYFPTPLRTNAAHSLVSAVFSRRADPGAPGLAFTATASFNFGAPRSPERSGIRSGLR